MEKFRDAIREIVADEHADPDRLGARIMEWVQRESRSDPDFVFKMLEEFGEPIPENIERRVLDAVNQTRGDLVSALKHFNEMVDKRENPTAASEFRSSLLNAFIRVLGNATEEEMRRHDEHSSS